MKALLAGPRLPLVAAGLAVLIALPSLWAGLDFDDYHLKLLMQDAPPQVRLIDHPLDMFRLISGEPQRMREWHEFGLLPWWSDLEIQGAFWRPLTSATHWLDYRLWPQWPALMHAQSIAWYALLAGAVSVLYRRVLGATAVAGLAAVLYVIDDAHGMPVGFLSNRNAILAALFGTLALVAHLRWRRDGWRPGAWAGPALLGLSLLAKEEGVATCGYLAAFALLLDRAGWRGRLASLLPYAAVVIAWRVAWVALGYGVRGIEIYQDPLREPLRFALAVVQHVPVLLLAQFAGLTADLAVVLEGRWLSVYCLLAAAGTTAVLALLAPVVRASRTARFWLVGMLLAVIPLCSAFPADRMLLLPGLGGMGILAEWFARWSARRAAGRGGLVSVSAVALVVIHGVLAPLGFVYHAAAPLGPRAFQEKLYLAQPLDAAVAEQDLVIVNPPLTFALMATPLIWVSEHAPLPRTFRVLASNALQPVEVARTDEHTLVVRPAAGYLASKMDRLVRRDGRPLPAGAEVCLPGMTATVLEATAGGRPASVAFRFDVPLEDPSLRWLAWRAGAYEPFVPPRVGTTVVLPASWRDLF